jgi:hypothetical protein
MGSLVNFAHFKKIGTRRIKQTPAERMVSCGSQNSDPLLIQIDNIGRILRWRKRRRPVEWQQKTPNKGRRVLSLPRIGGLHHHYDLVA